LPRDIGIISVSRPRSRTLNRIYRGRNKATNILSFRYGSTYGEIILCPDVIREEAKKQKHSIRYQTFWMIIHGMIHLSGFHHESSHTAEKRTRAIEASILTKIFN
jgi:probable rRNA maturation factor